MDDLSNYLHFYYGAPFIKIFKDGTLVFGKIECYPAIVGYPIFSTNQWCNENEMYELWEHSDLVDFKLILRTPFDLTPFERDMYRSLREKKTFGHHVVSTESPHSTRFLISRAIDCFGLIEKGLAEDFAEIIKKKNEHPARLAAIEVLKGIKYAEIEHNSYKNHKNT